MSFNNIVCPISLEKTDNNVSRFTIFINVVLIVLFLITNQFIFMFLVSIDYFIRAFLKTESSPFRWIAFKIAENLKWDKKMIGLAPKIFASRLGFLCAISSAMLYVLGFNTFSLIEGSLLLIFTIGDAVFNLCVGCLIYNYLVFPFYKNQKPSE